MQENQEFEAFPGYVRLCLKVEGACMMFPSNPCIRGSHLAERWTLGC